MPSRAPSSKIPMTGAPLSAHKKKKDYSRQSGIES